MRNLLEKGRESDKPLDFANALVTDTPTVKSLPLRLLIISHVTHYQRQDGIYAHGPYAREIEIWADMFEQVVIAAPCRDGVPETDTHRIDRPNVSVAPQKEVGGATLRAKLHALAMLPLLIADLCREMRKADAIHVRCPGNLGLLGALLAPLFSNRLIAKYAGQWAGYPREARTVRWQRQLLASKWWRGPVTVYGKFPDQPAHVVSFFTSVLTSDQLVRARSYAVEKSLKAPLTVAYSGRLTPSKNVDTLLQALAALKSEGVHLNGLIIGTGPEDGSLRSLADRLGIRDQIVFTGGVSAEQVLSNLRKADVFVLAANTEGWGKAIIEAMASGLVCIGGNLGMMPTFLAEGRGFTIPPRDVTALTNTLRQIASCPQAYETMRLSASEWAQQYSLENLRDALLDLMMKSWRLPSAQLSSQSAVEVVR